MTPTADYRAFCTVGCRYSSPVPARREANRSDEALLVHHELHVDLAYFNRQPDYLLLFCLRGDHERHALTYVTDVRDAYVLLSPKVRRILREPRFGISARASFHASQDRPLWSRPRHVLSGPKWEPQLCVNLNGTQGVGAEANRALAELRRALSTPTVIKGVCLEPGDCLLIDNRKAAHEHGLFRPRFDGFDRWLQQVYICTNLFHVRAAMSGPRLM